MVSTILKGRYLAR